MSDIPLTDFPELDYTPDDEPTQPLPLMERAQPRSAQDEIALIRVHYARIASGIELFWGHRDCGDYLRQLILNGGDGVGRTRLGFKHEVVQALLNLIALHEDPRAEG